ncbi:MAG: response regulator [Cellvibrionaceae bacterium]|nr:response regulator [Cellvibrionaceae bacterium]MCV6626877.1 response regulator [Cellvibrionaceae bacterium]
MSYPKYGSLRMLIVDDFDNFRVTVAKLMQSLGVPTVDMALNGVQAIKACRSRRYDVVFCDFNLGQGKNGQQVLEELRQEEYLSPTGLFVFVSAESSRSVVLAANEFEPDGYITKPITAKAIQQRIDRLLVQREELLPALRAMEDKDYESAIEQYRELIAAGSRYSNICQKRLGELYLITDNYTAAEQLYQEILEKRRVDWAVVGLARAQQAQENWDDSAKMLRDIILENPLCMSAYDALADDYEQRGDTMGLQQLLQKSVKMSPLSLSRNRQLADVALKNNDTLVAANSFRKLVRLGNNSCNDEVGNHLQYGRTAAALADSEPEEGREVLRDALLNIESLDRRFELTEDEKIQAGLIESRIFSAQGNKKRAKEALQQMEGFMGAGGRRQEFETELDRVYSLFALGENTRAQQCLQDLVRLYEKDQQALGKLDILLDEPASEENRAKVKEINREGISFYRNHQYEDAITCFLHARQLFPNHVGIMLNLVQAYTGHIKAFGFNSERMKQCEGTLALVESRVEVGHAQFERFRQLRDICRTISQGGRRTALD